MLTAKIALDLSIVHVWKVLMVMVISVMISTSVLLLIMIVLLMLIVKIGKEGMIVFATLAIKEMELIAKMKTNVKKIYTFVV